MRQDRINEGSFYDVTATFLDSAYVATTPTTVRYRIDCQTTGATVKDWTSTTPGSSVTIRATATDNKIQDGSNRSEVKVMTVQADAGTDGQYTEKYTWVVRNLQGIT